jgi:phosphoglycolate phosphatase
MRQIDLVIFDWDGTLVDSAAHIVASIQAASLDAGLAPPSDADARHIIGLGLLDAMTYLFPALPPERYGLITDRYKYHYVKGESVVVLFEGVAEGLGVLRTRGQSLAVATGKSRVGLERAMDATGLRARFDATRCGDEGFTKPHPGMLEYLLEHLDVPKERALMVGDTTHDIEMANNAGVASVAVAYGAHEPEKLQTVRPDVTVYSPEELWDWLRRNA